MKKTLITLVAVAALAVPTAAYAHDGQGHHFGHHHANGLFTKVSGTGSSFAATSATATGTVAGEGLLSAGTFSATLTTTWASADTKTSDHGTLSCAPATLALTVTDSASSANSTSGTLTGKTCTFKKTDGTVFTGFFGKGAATGTGTLAGVTGDEHAFLSQKADGTVKGAVFGGFAHMLGTQFTTEHKQFTSDQKNAEHKTGDCGSKH